jgi:glycosidase
LQDPIIDRRAFLKYGAALLVVASLGTLSLPKLRSAHCAPSYSHPAWSNNRTLYEVDRLFFTATGKFREIAAEMPRLRNLGVGIVYLMPSAPRGGIGNMYCWTDHMNPDPVSGTWADYRYMVDTAHANDIKVIQDFVCHSTANTHVWTRTHPEYYKRDASGNLVRTRPEWPHLYALDWNKRVVWDAMREACLTWIRHGDIDGFRWDVAPLMPEAWYRKMREAAQDLKEVFFLAEGDSAWLAPENDMTYSEGIIQLWQRVTHGAHASNEIGAFLRRDANYPAGHLRMRYTSTRDSSYNGNSQFADYNGEVATGLLASVALLLPGKPMIYCGEETGNRAPLNGSNRVTTKAAYADPNNIWRVHFRKLLSLYRDNPAVHAGAFEKFATNADGSVYAFGRKDAAASGRRVVVLANLSAQFRTVSVSIPKAYRTTYTGLFSGARIGPLGNTYQVTLSARDYRVMYT